MKKVVLSISALLLCIISIAQVPESFNYQAIVRDGGVILQNQLVSYRFSIIKGPLVKGEPIISVVYTEKHSVTTNQFGLISLIIGNGTEKTSDFTLIDWGSDTYSLKVEIDISGGTNYIDFGTTMLLSVPYAMHAKTAVSITGNLVETDPVFKSSSASEITQVDITNWNNKLEVEVDGSVTNELQTLSIEGNVISLTNGGQVELPALSGQYLYADKDNDNYGYRYSPVWVPAGVDPPLDFVTDSCDCNDTDNSVNPGAEEILANGIDDNCDGVVDGSGDIPSSFDWRDYEGQNWMTPVKSQGNCGSCYAFATLAALEAKIRMHFNNSALEIDLSEQEIVSCSPGNLGCSGGYIHLTLNYILDHGITEESFFPYVSGSGTVPSCYSETPTELYKISGYESIVSTDPSEIKEALINNGPVVFISEVYTDLISYSGGIYIPDKNLPAIGAKACTIVGYNDSEGYWIIRNTWGEAWGESGYYRLAYSETASFSLKYVINNVVIEE